MKPFLRLALLAALASAFPPAASAKPQEETIFLFENRKVVVLVPDGFGFASSKDEHGLMSIEIGHPKNKIRLTLTFMPDPDGALMSARTRKEYLNERFNDYVENSVEKAMQFEELDPKQGEGTFCLFTDEKLVGQSKLPPNEYLHFISGVKAWPGVGVLFGILCNDTQSKEYHTVLAVLRDSVEERTLTPLL